MTPSGWSRRRLDYALARALAFTGTVPGLGEQLRRAVRRSDGSIVTIKTGFARGRLWIREPGLVSGYWLGHYEFVAQSIVADGLRPGDAFWDVGAGGGFFSLVAAGSVGLQGQIVAIEPDPANAALLRRHVELNRLENALVIEAAVGRRNGTAAFVRETDRRTGRLGRQTTAGITVPVITLDDLSFRFRPPRLIKIDVEGGELGVLIGAGRVLASETRPILLIEVHRGRIGRALGSRLQSDGYQVRSLAGRGSGTGTDHVLATPIPERLVGPRGRG